MKSKTEIIEYEEIISDIAGNQFIIKIYIDLDGKLKKEIKPYFPNELKFNNILYK